MSTDLVFDQDAVDPDVVDINDTTSVYRDTYGRWGYECRHRGCPMNTTTGNPWHSRSGYITRALAVDAATQHVDTVRARREVIT